MFSVSILLTLLWYAEAQKGWNIRYISKAPRNEYEEWGPVRKYLVDDYRQAFQCHGMAQYCKGSVENGYCGYKYTDGAIGCFHPNFFGARDVYKHDGHCYCNCLDLTCKYGSHRILKRDGSDEGCQKITGEWVMFQECINCNGQVVEATEGFSVEQDWSWTSTEEYSESVTRSVSAGFDVGGIGADAFVTSNESHRFSISDQKSWSVKQSSAMTRKFNFGQGVVWQWQYKVMSSFGQSTCFTMHFALTNNVANPPCCLPGMFQDVNHPASGSCVRGPDLCPRQPTVLFS